MTSVLNKSKAVNYMITTKIVSKFSGKDTRNRLTSTTICSPLISPHRKKIIPPKNTLKIIFEARKA